MKGYKVDKIRNVAFLGHGGSGKTTLVEAILYTLGELKRMGKVEDGNTVSDFDKEEISRQFTIGTSIVPVEFHNSKLNILDTPGYFDFVGETNSALRVAGGAVIVVDAASGVQVGTEKAWRYTEERETPKVIFINKMDKENIDYLKVINQLKDHFGKKIAPFAIPIGTGNDLEGFINVVDMEGRKFEGTKVTDGPIPESYQDRVGPLREMLIEAVAESDEELLEKYFEGIEFTTDEFHTGLRKGVLNGDIVPVIVGSATKCLGAQTLLDVVIEYLPTPFDMHEGTYEGVNPDTEENVVRHIDESEPFSALIFKTIVDPFVGKISLFKVYSGSAKKDDEILNASRDKYERFNSIFLVRGKKQLEVAKIVAGDIGATAKLQYAETGDTLCDKGSPIKYPGIRMPKPCLYMSVEPKDKADEEKIGSSLYKLIEEDPSFTIERNRETKQQLIGGLGTMHLSVIKNKLSNIFGVEVDLGDQKIAYRETIKGTATVQGKHKKQSGGSGQYGDVHIRFEPSAEKFEFAEEVFGGSVPRQYIPAVEKGLQDAVKKGVLAGYPVVNIKATLFDGSYHAVDSNEMAFKMAANIAFKKGMEIARPVLLEPVMHVEIIVPDDYMGDIMGDMNKRRGRILGMEPYKNGRQKVVAEAPQSELFKYATDLRSMTQARGEFTMKFDRYEEVPTQLADKIIEKAKSSK